MRTGGPRRRSGDEAAGDVASPPAWLSDLPTRLSSGPQPWFEEFAPPSQPRRRSAVLMLFGPRRATPVPAEVDADGGDLDIVLTERAATLRSHAAQVAFPGGHLDPGDGGAIDAALREAGEEVGLRPSSARVLGALPPLYLHPSRTAVTPVLAWWQRPHPIGVVDTAEVAKVARVPVTELLDPGNRFTVRAGGYRSPGFSCAGLFVWGFTAKLLDTLFEVAGLTRPWDHHRERPLPQPVVDGYRRSRD